ncbi:MAG: hypothetical protein HEQ35_31140 [Gloeotrichia echinulata IR180]
MGIGDWGLGTLRQAQCIAGDWGLGIGHKEIFLMPHAPCPMPHTSASLSTSALC